MTERRPNVLALTIPIVLAFVGMGLSLWGWTHGADGQAIAGVDSDLIYKALRSIGVSDTYAHADNLPLDVARWIGVGVAFWAVISLFYSAINVLRAHLMVAIRRNHIALFGQSAFAEQFAEIGRRLKVQLVHLCEGNETLIDGELIRIPIYRNDERALKVANVAAARRIIIAVDNDAVAVDIAMKAQFMYPRSRIALHLNDLWLSRKIDSLIGAERLRSFTDATAAAREIVRRHLPFLLAEDLDQTRIHSVLIGDHDWLEAIMVETIVTACTLRYGKPAFTFFCIEPHAFHDRLFTRYPDLANAADIAVGPISVGAHTPLSIVDLADLTRQGPVTAVYCALADETQSLSTAIAFRDLVHGEIDFKAPIFVHMVGNGMPRPVPASRLAPSELVPFGDIGDIARASDILSVHGDAAEQAWHKAYLSFAPEDKAAARPWDELPEEFRTSNLRAVGHIYAKLFEAGFDLRPWLATHDSWKALPSIAKGQSIWRDQVEHRKLAMLEHERWIADRRMSGWVGGTVRHNQLKIHDNIVPFDDLSDELQGYDYKFVDILAKVLKTAKDGVTRPGKA